MPFVGRAFASITSRGGAIATGIPSVLVDDTPIATVGSIVTPHLLGTESPHTGVVMVTGFPTVLVSDIPVCIPGSVASCGDIMLASVTSVEVG